MLIKNKKGISTKFKNKEVKKIIRSITMSKNKDIAKANLVCFNKLNEKQIEYVLSYKINEIIVDEEKFLEGLNNLK